MSFVDVFRSSSKHYLLRRWTSQALPWSTWHVKHQIRLLQYILIYHRKTVKRLITWRITRLMFTFLYTHHHSSFQFLVLKHLTWARSGCEGDKAAWTSKAPAGPGNDCVTPPSLNREWRLAMLEAREDTPFKIGMLSRLKKSQEQQVTRILKNSSGPWTQQLVSVIWCRPSEDCC